MATEVKHGPQPGFAATLQPGSEFSIEIHGYYTSTPGLAAGGVTEHHFHASGGVKREAELLALRSIFLNWWLGQWSKNGGDMPTAMRHLERPSSIAGAWWA